MGHPPSKNWTLDFEPAFSPRFYFPLSPRSYFQTGQRFLLPKHMTSGCMNPRSLFPTGQRFPLPKHITSGCMSPRSLFPPGQRYPIPLPVMTSFLHQNEAQWAIRAQCTTEGFFKGPISRLFFLFFLFLRTANFMSRIALRLQMRQYRGNVRMKNERHTVFTDFISEIREKLHKVGRLFQDRIISILVIRGQTYILTSFCALE